LAGVVGGENSSIQDSTTDVFLEAAHFAPLVVRKTAKSYDLRTDSSARFEKSLDPCHAEMAIRRLVFLLKETCPKLVVNGAMVDEYPNPIPSRTIELAPTQVEKKMGFSISVEEQKNILTKLGFEVVESELLQVTVPSYRNTKDIEEPIDLVEEIGRIAGYDRIVPQSPRLSLESKPASLSMLRARRLQDFFVGRGYDEVKTYSFTSLSEMEALSLGRGCWFAMLRFGKRMPSIWMSLRCLKWGLFLSITMESTCQGSDKSCCFRPMGLLKVGRDFLSLKMIRLECCAHWALRPRSLRLKVKKILPTRLELALFCPMAKI
jgi:hypothetical protein